MTVTDEDILNHYGSTTPRGFKEGLLHQFATDNHNIFHEDDSYDHDGYSQIPEHLMRIKKDEKKTDSPNRDGGTTDSEDTKHLNNKSKKRERSYSDLSRKQGTSDLQKDSNNGAIEESSEQDDIRRHLYTEVNIGGGHTTSHQNNNESVYQSVEKLRTQPLTPPTSTESTITGDVQSLTNGDEDPTESFNGYQDHENLYATVIRKNTKTRPSQIYSSMEGSYLKKNSSGESPQTKNFNSQKNGASIQELETDDGFVIDLDELLRDEESNSNANNVAASYDNSSSSHNYRSSGTNYAKEQQQQHSRSVLSDSQNAESYYGDISTNYTPKEYTSNKSNSSSSYRTAKDSKNTAKDTSYSPSKTHSPPSWVKDRKQGSPLSTYRSENNSKNSAASSPVKSSMAIWREREAARLSEQQQHQQQQSPAKFTSRFKRKKDKNNNKTASIATKLGGDNTNSTKSREGTPRVSVKDMWQQRLQEQNKTDADVISDTNSSARPVLSSTVNDNYNQSSTTSVDYGEESYSHHNGDGDVVKNVDMSEESIEAMFDLGDDETNTADEGGGGGGNDDDDDEESFVDILRKQMMF